MPKILVETSGRFKLLDLSVRPAQDINHARPSVVVNSHFVQARVGLGQLAVLATLKDEATDAEFAKYVTESKGDMTLAVSSFVASFGLDAEPKSTKGKAKKPEAPQVA